MALGTITDFLWDPATYDPERSWQRAIAELGGADAWALQMLRRHRPRQLPVRAGPEQELTSKLERFEFDLAHGDATAAHRRVSGPRRPTAWPGRQRSLRSPAAHNPRLADELRPWLEKFAIGAEAVAALPLDRGFIFIFPVFIAELRKLADELSRAGRTSCTARCSRWRSIVLWQYNTQKGSIHDHLDKASGESAGSSPRSSSLQGFAGSAGGQAGAGAAEDFTLRVAMGSPGEAQIAVWEAAKAAFEEANPNVTVELNFQEDDLYETIGLEPAQRGRRSRYLFRMGRCPPAEPL